MSDRINCGVYIFTPDIFTAIQGVSSQRKDRGKHYPEFFIIMAMTVDILFLVCFMKSPENAILFTSGSFEFSL